jgi:hypothetical protein
MHQGSNNLVRTNALLPTIFCLEQDLRLRLAACISGASESTCRTVLYCNAQIHTIKPLLQRGRRLTGLGEPKCSQPVKAQVHDRSTSRNGEILTTFSLATWCKLHTIGLMVVCSATSLSVLLICPRDWPKITQLALLKDLTLIVTRIAFVNN